MAEQELVYVRTGRIGTAWHLVPDQDGLARALCGATGYEGTWDLNNGAAIPVFGPLCQKCERKRAATEAGGRS